MYATLYELKEYLRSLDLTGDDRLLARQLAYAEGVIKQYTGWDFEPTRATLMHDAPPLTEANVGAYSNYYFNTPQTFVMGQQLRLKEPLLRLDEVINGGATEPLDLANVLLIQAYLYPRYALELKKSSGLTWDANGEDRQQVISLTGVWGYHEEYPSAWVDTLETLQANPLLSDTTTLEVADITGVAGDALPQRFQVGNLLKLEDEDGYEFLLILAATVGTDPTPDTLTVLRGARGTVAREWAAGTKLYVYRPMPGVVQATLEVATLSYRRKDLDSRDHKQIMGTGVKITPETLPPYIQEMLPSPRAWL